MRKQVNIRNFDRNQNSFCGNTSIPTKPKGNFSIEYINQYRKGNNRDNEKRVLLEIPITEGTV